MSARPLQPGADALRATVGVVVAFGGALLIAGLVGLLAGNLGVGEARGAAATRAQLAVQAVAFGGAAVLLIAGLRLVERPGAATGLRAATGRPARPPVLTVIAVGAATAVGAVLVGPLVGAAVPSLSDPSVPVDDLALGSGGWPDLATVLVVAGLIPLGEELLFRGVLTAAWLRAGRPAAAVLSSTVLFGLAHATVGPRTMLVAALLGALFAAALLVSGSLGAPVLAHTIVNAIALLEAGLQGAAAFALLAACVVGATVAATRLSPLVSWPAPDGTLTP